MNTNEGDYVLDNGRLRARTEGDRVDADRTLVPWDDFMNTLDYVARRFDDRDANQYSEPSAQMKAIEDAVRETPITDRNSLVALLAGVLHGRLQIEGEV